jgi:hypothetical protein
MPERPFVSLNFVRKRATDLCKEAWKTSFTTAAYRGSSFLDFNGSNDKPLSPSYADGGTWLQHLDNTRLCARVCRAILDHAPHRVFRMRFHIEGDLYCSYCRSGAIQDRRHLISRCSTLACLRTFEGTPLYLPQFIEYLKDNYWLFSFDSPPPGLQRGWVGVQGWLGSPALWAIAAVRYLAPSGDRAPGFAWSGHQLIAGYYPTAFLVGKGSCYKGVDHVRPPGVWDDIP